jgi:RIO-like serine/threonine protein kinase
MSRAVAGKEEEQLLMHGLYLKGLPVPVFVELLRHQVICTVLNRLILNLYKIHVQRERATLYPTLRDKISNDVWLITVLERQENEIEMRDGAHKK